MKKFIQNNYWRLFGGLLGGIVGYFYWREVGCSSGTCLITSKPLNSILYFGVLGYFMLGTITAAREHKKIN